MISRTAKSVVKTMGQKQHLMNEENAKVAFGIAGEAGQSFLQILKKRNNVNIKGIIPSNPEGFMPFTGYSDLRSVKTMENDQADSIAEVADAPTKVDYRISSESSIRKSNNIEKSFISYLANQEVNVKRTIPDSPEKQLRVGSESSSQSVGSTMNVQNLRFQNIISKLVSNLTTRNQRIILSRNCYSTPKTFFHDSMICKRKPIRYDICKTIRRNMMSEQTRYFSNFCYAPGKSSRSTLHSETNKHDGVTITNKISTSFTYLSNSKQKVNFSYVPFTNVQQQSCPVSYSTPYCLMSTKAKKDKWVPLFQDEDKCDILEKLSLEGPQEYFSGNKEKCKKPLPLFDKDDSKKPVPLFGQDTESCADAESFLDKKVPSRVLSKKKEDSKKPVKVAAKSKTSTCDKDSFKKKKACPQNPYANVKLNVKSKKDSDDLFCSYLKGSKDNKKLKKKKKKKGTFWNRIFKRKMSTLTHDFHRTSSLRGKQRAELRTSSVIRFSTDIRGFVESNPPSAINKEIPTHSGHRRAGKNTGTNSSLQAAKRNVDVKKKISRTLKMLKDIKCHGIQQLNLDNEFARQSSLIPSSHFTPNLSSNFVDVNYLTLQYQNGYSLQEYIKSASFPSQIIPKNRKVLNHSLMASDTNETSKDTSLNRDRDSRIDHLFKHSTVQPANNEDRNGIKHELVSELLEAPFTATPAEDGIIEIFVYSNTFCKSGVDIKKKDDVFTEIKIVNLQDNIKADRTQNHLSSESDVEEYYSVTSFSVNSSLLTFPDSKTNGASSNTKSCLSGETQLPRKISSFPSQNVRRHPVSTLPQIHPKVNKLSWVSSNVDHVDIFYSFTPDVCPQLLKCYPKNEVPVQVDDCTSSEELLEQKIKLQEQEVEEFYSATSRSFYYSQKTSAHGLQFVSSDTDNFRSFVDKTYLNIAETVQRVSNAPPVENAVVISTLATGKESIKSPVNCESIQNSLTEENLHLNNDFYTITDIAPRFPASKFRTSPEEKSSLPLNENCISRHTHVKNMNRGILSKEREQKKDEKSISKTCVVKSTPKITFAKLFDPHLDTRNCHKTGIFRFFNRNRASDHELCSRNKNKCAMMGENKCEVCSDPLTIHYIAPISRRLISSELPKPPSRPVILCGCSPPPKFSTRCPSCKLPSPDADSNKEDTSKNCIYGTNSQK